MSIEATLKERGKRYGSFVDHAAIAQQLQDTMRSVEGWGKLAPDQKQALTVIADKIARMLNGAANYRDNWHDIVGYATLVDNRMLLEAMAAEQLAQCTVPTPVDKRPSVPVGYMPWSGGENPCDDMTFVSVVFKGGNIEEWRAGLLHWYNPALIAYRTL